MATYGYLTSSPYHETVHNNHHHQCSKASYYYHKRGESGCGISADNLSVLVKLINFILFFACLITLIFIALYDKPSFGDDRDYSHLPIIRSFLPDSHPLNLLHCQLIVCSLLISTLAVINLALECHYTTKFRMKDDFPDHHEMNEISDGFCSHQGTPYRNSITVSEKVANSLPSFPICISIFAYLMLFTVQLCLGTFAILSVYGSSSDESYKDGFERSMIIQLGQPEEILHSRSQIFDVLQSELRCCGINDYQDYVRYNSTSNDRDTFSIPESCCKTPTPKCGERKHPNNIHYVGCAKKMAKIASDNILLLGWITILFLFLELFAIVFSCCLYVQSVASR